MIRPTGSILLDNCSLADEKPLENIQRLAALMCTGGFRRTGTTSLLAEAGWDSLKSRRSKSKLMLFFQLTNGDGPPHLEGKIMFAPIKGRASRSGLTEPIHCRTHVSPRVLSKVILSRLHPYMEFVFK